MHILKLFEGKNLHMYDKFVIVGNNIPNLKSH